MKTKALATCLLLILTVASFGFVAPAQGDPEEGEWFTSYRVEDPRTGQLMVEVDFATDENRSMAPIFGGSALVMKFTVDVPVTSPLTRLKLKTNLLTYTLTNSTLTNSTLTNSTLTNSTLTNSTLTNSTIEIPYWELVSTKYKLYRFKPNSTEVTFYEVKGKLTMKLHGKVPLTAVQDTPVRYIVVSLYDSDGETLDEIRVTVITAVMDEYQSLLMQKEKNLQALKDGGVDPEYIELYENVLNESKVQASLGYVYSAIGMLNTLEVSNQPDYSTVESLFLPVVGVLIIVAVALGALFVRERIRKNKSSPAN